MTFHRVRLSYNVRHTLQCGYHNCLCTVHTDISHSNGLLDSDKCLAKFQLVRYFSVHSDQISGGNKFVITICFSAERLIKEKLQSVEQLL